MTDERGLPLIVLCPPGERVPLLDALAARPVTAGTAELSLDRSEGEVAERVARLRSELGSVAIGVVARDEPSALLALEAGADESITLSRLDQDSVLGFLDRVMLRARLRGERDEMRALYVHHEKLAALGALVAGFAHEVNNPLTALMLTVEALRLRASGAGLETAQALDLLEEVEVAARTIAAVVRDLKVFSRPDSDDAAPEPVELRALFEQVLRVVGRQVRSVATLELDFEPALPEVVVPAARLAQVFTNILINAAQAVSQVARPQHVVRVSARSDDETVAVSISDTGPGIPPGVVPRIFEPFFTTKERGAGTGLGLSISRSILRRFGGDLLVDSVHGDGATFIVLIPRPTERDLTEARARAHSLPLQLGPSAARRSVLVAEPDARVLRAIARALEPSFDVVGVASAEQAIQHAASGARFDAVIADVSAPEFVGTVLYRFLCERQSELLDRLVFIFGEEQEAPVELAEAVAPRLSKPIGQKALLRALHGRLR